MPAVEYRLKPRARQDLEEVWLYSLSQWGVERANRYVDDLTAAFELLANNPRAGARFDNIRHGYRRYPVVRHVVYYREAQDGIEIVRILHDRMLASRYL